MRLPKVRFTLRRLMIAVAVIAADFGLIRMAEDLAGENYYLTVVLLAYALVPSLSLLTVAAVSIGLGLMRSGKAPAFLTGYLLLGGLVSFGMCLVVATQELFPTLFTVTVITPDPEPASSLNNKNIDIISISIFTFPQVISALIGGGLAARYGLTIVLSGRAIPPDAAMDVTSNLSTRADRTDP